MSPTVDLLYEYWIGIPDPRHWPEELRDDPVIGHGKYAFTEGLRLGLLLASEAFFPESQL